MPTAGLIPPLRPAAAGIDYNRKWYAMAAVGMGVFLSTVDGSIVNIALPILVKELRAPFAAVQWVVLAYLLTVATLLPSVGRLADMRGKKRIYMTGFLVFTTGSVLCGLAPTVEWLIALRVVQAIGAAMVQALGQAIVTEAFPPQERGKALGIMGAVVSVGIIAGPTLGGLILGSLSWHWIFFVNLPVGLLGLWIAWRNLPATQPRGGQRFDFAGAAALLVTLLSLLLALTLGQGWGFLSTPALALFAAAIVGLVCFIWIERRVAHPMIDLALFRSGAFGLNLTTGLLLFMGLSGTTLLLPFYLQGMRGFDVQKAGLLLAVTPVALGFTAPISGTLSDRFGSRRISVLGLLVVLGGFAGLATLRADTPVWAYVLRMAPVGVGMGLFQSPNNSAIMGAAPRDRLGVASGLLALTRTLGSTTGTAIVGALWAGLVAVALGGVLPAGGATEAPVAAQIAALNGAFLAVCGVVLVALALSLHAYSRERAAGRRQGITGALE